MEMSEIDDARGEETTFTEQEIENLVDLCIRRAAARSAAEVKMSEPNYTALTENEQALQALGILGDGIYDTFYSVKDAVTQMKDYINAREKEIDKLKELLAGERREITWLRNENIEIHMMIECTNCKRGVRPRFAICGMCSACAEVKLKQLQYAVKSWLEEETDWKAEEKRLREIEMAVRECPTATTCLGCVKALVYTTQLRDALKASP